MEEFLGVLFCGGRGKRISNLTDYISKSLIPVYDKPLFKFGLELLEKSNHISEIILLTNENNDSIFQNSGYRTIVQDDSIVNDMFTGWEYIKKITDTKKNGVLVPSDNISNINADRLIEIFLKDKSDFLFSVFRIRNKKKLSEMGNFDVSSNKFRYKDPNPTSEYGVIAPYIISNKHYKINSENIFESENKSVVKYKGVWFDLGDYESISEANNWYRKLSLRKNEINN